jgi:nucleotide-binding universal stress UspA family protein
MTATLFSSIVCSVDFSDHSVRALRHAIALAGHALGRVTVIHVANPLLVQAAKAAYDVATINQETETELRALADDLATEAGAWAPEVRTIISVGDPATEIIKCAEEDDADMIVMGTHGRSGYRKMFFGSVTEQVLRRSPVPVLAVPASDHERVTFTDKGPQISSGPILAPTDLSAQSLVNTQIARSLSVSFATPLLLVHVIEPVPVIGLRHQSIEAHKRAVVADAHERLRIFASELARGEPVETMSMSGPPPPESRRSLQSAMRALS